MELKEKKISSEEIYKGKIIDVYRDKVLCPNGKESYREYIKHCRASCIIAKLPNGKFLMEKQYRYPYDEVIYEFPAGKCDKDEDPAITAKRELEEETGYLANKIEYIGEIYPSCAYTDEIIYIYFATGLVKTHKHWDENERVEVFELTMDEILDLTKKGILKDAKSVSGLAYYFARGLDKVN